MDSRIPGGRVTRGGQLGRLAAGGAVRGAATRLAMVGRPEQARKIMAERSAMQTAQQAVTVLGSMRGAAMKIGQMLSVLDLDLVPESYREQFRARFAELRDSAPEFPFDEMRGVVEGDLGPLSRVFAEFDETAVAAASIGQVYRARLHDGRAVAVKVKYPGVDEAVAADMRNLAWFGKLWKSVLPTVADTAFLDEITRNILGELDYPREAHTQHRIAHRYRDHPFVTVPDVVGEFCGRHVLVTEFVDGRSFEHLRELPDADRGRYGELIYRFYIGSLFTDNEFCGDPHPGNILLGADGRLCFVDFGLFHTMDAVHVELERTCLRAACELRGEDVYREWVNRGIVDPGAGVTPRECLEYIWAAAGWHLFDDELEITPELATSALILAADPRRSEFHGLRHQLLPPEHAFSRRADLFTFAALGQLRTTANWHRLAREWMYGEPPATEIGRTIARWRAGRDG
ncbi:ABC1 kinase family protein [Nocardia sp. NPDC003345]